MPQLASLATAYTATNEKLPPLRIEMASCAVDADDASRVRNSLLFKLCFCLTVSSYGAFS